MRGRLNILRNITILAAMATTVHAETLALWELDDLAGSSSNAAVDTTHPNISSTDLATGDGIDTAIDWPYTLGGYADWHLGSSLQYAINTGDDYFTTTLTADAGKMVSYSNLFARFAVNAGDDGAYLTFHLLSDQAGFTTNDVLGSFTVEDTRTADWSSIIHTNNFDLSTVSELQGVQGAAEFRIYVTATNGNRMAIGHDSFLNNTDDFRFDGIVEAAASPLASWDNDNLSGTERSNAVHFVESGMTASDLALSHRWFNDLPPWTNSIWALISDLPGVTNLASAITENRYFGFFMEPETGMQANYAKVSVRITLNNYFEEGTTVEFVLMSSATGFADGDEIGSFLSSTSAGEVTDNGLIGIDINAVEALQNVTDEVEFRLYVVLDGGSYSRMGIGHIFREDGADDVRVDGVVAELPPPLELVVSSEHGSAIPSAGTHVYSWGTNVDCFVDDFAIEGGTNYTCSGWIGTGSVPSAGTNNFTDPITLTNLYSSITWNWVESDYWLETSVSGNGFIIPGTGWYSAGTNLPVSAVPDNGWLFMYWSGDLSGDYSASDTALLFDSEKSITATFSDDADGDGLLNSNEWAIGTDPRNSDTDGDGFDDYYEITEGLSPTNDNSSIIAYILDNQPTFGLYTEEQLGALAVGNLMIQSSNSEIYLDLQLMKSTDLVTWTNAGNAVEWSMTAGEKEFYKVRAEP